MRRSRIVSRGRLRYREQSAELEEGQKERREQLEQALGERQRLATQIEEYQAERQRLSAALDAEIADRQQRETEYREQSAELEEGQKERREQLEQALGERQRLATQIEEYQAERQRLSAALDAEIADRQQRETEYREKSAELEEGQKERREQLEHALAERQQLAAQIEEYQAERQRLSAALDAQIADRQQRETEYREKSAELEEGQKERREQLEQALAERQQLAAQIEEYQAERQRLSAALDAQIADRQQREVDYREKSAELERRAEESQLAFLTREHDARNRIVGLEAELAASNAEQRRLASAYEQQLHAGHQALGSHEQNRQELVDLELRLQAATGEQARLVALVAEHEAQRTQHVAEHRAAVDSLEQSLGRAREETGLAIEQRRQALAELGAQLAHALDEQSRLSGLIEERERERDRLDAEHRAAVDGLEQLLGRAREETGLAIEQRRQALAELGAQLPHALDEQSRLSGLIEERERERDRLDAEHRAAVDGLEQLLGRAREETGLAIEQRRQALAELGAQLSHALGEQSRLSGLIEERERERDRLDAEHRAAVDSLEQSLGRAREETALAIEQRRQALAEMGTQLSHALGEQSRLSGLVEEHERERDRIAAGHRRAVADLEASNGEALAECERVLTGEHEQIRQQSERQRFEIADLKKRHAEAVAEQQRLSDLMREHESQQARADADRGRTIGDIEARHQEVLTTRAQAWHDEREQIRQRSDDLQREVSHLRDGQDKAVADQRRLSELLKQAEAERQQTEAGRAADRVEIERRFTSALETALAARESANRERIASLQLELGQAVTDQMRLQTQVAQGEGRQKRVMAEYAADRAQAERALGEAIFKKNRVLKALADQRVELQRWQDAATELEPLAAAGRLAADVAGELQEVLRHVDEQANFVLTLCSSDAVPRAEIETLRADALRAASLARQFVLSKARQLEVPFPAEPEHARVSADKPNEPLEEL